MLAAALECLYPPRCALCGEFDNRPICPVCRSEIPKEDTALQQGPPPIDFRAAVHHYHGRAAQAVRRLKYDRVLTHAHEMAQEIAALANTHGLIRADAVVPVPIHWSRRCERGFNQSEVLAARLESVKPDLLVRRRRTRQQVGLSAEQRTHNLSGAFRAGNVKDLSILLLDDVVTSGGTAKECARVLKEAGAYRVDLITYCSGGSVLDL